VPGSGPDDDLGRVYAARFPPEVRAARDRLWATFIDAFVSRWVPGDATVLDLGAGHCHFVNQVPAARRIAIDLDPETPRLAAPGVEVHSLPLQRLAEVVAPDSVDFALASNVLEHLPDPATLLEVLRAVHDALRPGGRLMVVQPNVRLVGPAFWDFFDHTLPLTERGMTEALSAAGLRVVECRPGFLPYTTRTRVPKWPELLRLYLALPPLQWVFGKQMCVVAERPA